MSSYAGYITLLKALIDLYPQVVTNSELVEYVAVSLEPSYH